MAEEKQQKRNLKSWILFFKGTVFRLSLREKSLAFIFVLALLGVWASMQLDRHLAAFAGYHTIQSDIDDQDTVLNNQEDIRTRFEAEISKINLEDLPNRDEVNASIDELVRKRAFTFKSSLPKSEPGIPLTFHNYSASITGLLKSSETRFPT